MNKLYKILFIFIISIVSFIPATVYAQENSNIYKSSVSKEGYIMNYKLRNITTDLNGKTCVGMPLKNFMILGNVKDDNDQIISDSLSWENPEYIIVKGSQTVNILYTTYGNETYSCSIEIIGIDEPWRITGAAYMDGCTIDCVEGTTIDKLETPFWFYGENVKNVLTGKLSYLCDESLTLGEHKATWTFIPNDTTYTTISGTMVINVVKNYKTPVSTETSLTANTINFSSVGLNYDININNKPEGSTFAWTSNNITIATVNATSGLVTAKAIGNATITCKETKSDGTTKTYTAKVTVGNDDGNPILNETSLDLSVDELFDLNVENKISGSCTYKYKSSNADIVTVKSLTGKLTAVADGNAYITCTIKTPDLAVYVLKCNVSIN